MAESPNSLCLKALVAKGRNEVIFIESDSDFVDVLLSFLTIAMGTIISLGRNCAVPLGIGCMKNLYESVENVDVLDFRNSTCREMLLCPRNRAEFQCKNLQLKIYDGELTKFFYCSKCTPDKSNLLSYCSGDRCPCCHCNMSSEMNCCSLEDDDSGFVKERSRFIVTDNLQVLPPLIQSSICLFTKFGVVDKNSIEEMTINVAIDDVLHLLMCSFVSKTPLTKILLKKEPVPEPSNININGRIHVKIQNVGDNTNEEDNISIKLVVSKSKETVCYAEAGDDFVSLLFSFLTLPLGSILKKMGNTSSLKGCTDQLYYSVQDLDEQYLKSNSHKELLVNPRLVPGFCYPNLLGIEEASYSWIGNDDDMFGYATDSLLIPSNSLYQLEVKDPKSQYSAGKSARGFLKGPVMFIVTDNLIIRPISPVFGISVLDQLNVSFNDIDVQSVHVGKEEAWRILIASFLGNSALTNAFLQKPKPEQEDVLLKEPRQEQEQYC
ncbi:hypothetical protein M0R45_017328 [Rubus argutus]|uniref:DUF674 family protein n=1 Tax=Rubus argutus TaxID=59490 RepID=A0AAW1XUM6_RUBAR